MQNEKKLFIRITFNNPINACFSNKKNTVSDQTIPIIFIQKSIIISFGNALVYNEIL